MLFITCYDIWTVINFVRLFGLMRFRQKCYLVRFRETKTYFGLE